MRVNESCCTCVWVMSHVWMRLLLSFLVLLIGADEL